MYLILCKFTNVEACLGALQANLHCNINSLVGCYSSYTVAATGGSDRGGPRETSRLCSTSKPTWERARARVNPAPTKLYDQHNTQQAMPVHTRTKAAAQSPL